MDTIDNEPFPHLVSILRRVSPYRSSSKLHPRRLLVLLAVSLFFTGAYYTWQVFTIGAAYKAKILCGNVFISQRDPVDILREDLTGPEKIIFTQIDFEHQSVTAWLPGIPTQRALYIPSLGCVLLAGSDETEFRKRVASWHIPPEKHQPAPPQRFVKQHTSGFNQKKLHVAIDNAFAETDPGHTQNTRAIIVLDKGAIAAERYAPNFSAQTLLLGWSMAKSVMNGLTGILVKQGKLSLQQTALVSAWRKKQDPRSHINLNQLLSLTSGLESLGESGDVISETTMMLYRSPNAADYAIHKPLRFTPGEHWKYESGSTNIIAAIIREQTNNSPADMLDFMRRELFLPLGMQQALIEIDASGNFLGSSFIYATARDWAAFGQLYVQDGIWQGRRLLPSGWVEYSTNPGKAAMGQYGAHFWTNGGSDSSQNQRPFPSLPGDLYYASGYKGQRLIIIPSRQLVIVRLGWSMQYNMQQLVADILAAQLPRT